MNTVEVYEDGLHFAVVYLYVLHEHIYEDDVPHAVVSMFYMNTDQLYEDNVLNSSCCSICVVCEHTGQLREDHVRFLVQNLCSA